MTTWRWLDLIPESDVAADAVATFPVSTPTGETAGMLTWWASSPERPARALRVDARLLSGGGQATWISWCRFDGEKTLPFDDGAVTGALRRRLRQTWPEAVSTMLVDWSRIAGAVTTGASHGDVVDDPFAEVFPRRLLRVDAGHFGPIPAPTGPGITRYGSGNPWPWDQYAGQVP